MISSSRRNERCKQWNDDLDVYVTSNDEPIILVMNHSVSSPSNSYAFHTRTSRDIRKPTIVNFFEMILQHLPLKTAKVLYLHNKESQGPGYIGKGFKD